jgi:transcriptional regulator with XRE-family HTH domain
VNHGQALREARRRAGLTQREVAARSGLPQPAIARMERGRGVPRVDTVERALRACGAELRAAPALGVGVDRTAIRELLALTPGQRARLAVTEARNLERALAAARR